MIPYELTVGWRYLYRRTDKPFGRRWAVACALVTAVGAVLFLATQWQAVGAAALAIGAVGLAASLLSLIFSAFTTISVIGLAFGVATLIWVLSVTSGFHQEFRRKVLGVNAHVIVLKYGVDFSEYRRVMETAEKVAGIVASSPFVFNEMMMAKGNQLSGVLVKGVDPERVGNVLDLPQHLVDTGKAAPGDRHSLLGRLLTSTQQAKKRGEKPIPGVIIGRDLAQKIGAKQGDIVRLVSPLQSLDTFGWSSNRLELPQSRDFRISAIFDSGFAEYDKRLVYVNLSEAQAFFEQGDVVTGVEMKTNDMFGAKVIAKRVSRELQSGIYRTVDWSELNRNLFTALQMQKLVLQMLIGFMVVVAAFNILSALTVLSIRKTREIAILKSMGMPRRGVSRIFQSAGVIVWFFGTGIGLLWGYLGALALRYYRFPLDPKVYLIRELPVQLKPWEFGLTAMFALLVCLIATLYPAMRAGRLSPVQGLRHT